MKKAVFLIATPFILIFFIALFYIVFIYPVSEKTDVCFQYGEVFIANRMQTSNLVIINNKQVDLTTCSYYRDWFDRLAQCYDRTRKINFLAGYQVENFFQNNSDAKDKLLEAITKHNDACSEQKINPALLP